ncbi:MAG: YjbE family putative metal transport protein [Hyphomonadaceae bacterium]
MINDIAALLEVIVIDLALSADNAVAVGLAAAALPAVQRRRAVTWGVGLALVLRIAFGLITVQLLRIRGLLAAGGALLFWIAGRMWADLRRPKEEAASDGAEAAAPHAQKKIVTFRHALTSIVAANIALSLDNVLAVAGVSRNEPVIMAFGLVLSVVLMGVAAALIARIVDEHRWIAALGILAIVLAGAVMCWEDAHAFFPSILPAPPPWLGGPAHA